MKSVPCLLMLLILCVLLACSVHSVNQPGPAPPDQQEPDDALPRQFTVEVVASDGIKLSTDVYLPEGDGPWPVLLIRTPYNNDQEAANGANANAKGYVLVAQDMRGRFDSEGENIPMLGTDLGELRDGYATYLWLAQQPWCNGVIGTLGGSALGMAQLYAACLQPPGLRCQFIGVAPVSMYHQFAYVGGAYREEQMDGWVDIAQFDPASIPIWHEHPTYDEYWQQYSILEHVAEHNVPGMHYGGWLDTFSQGTIDSFMLRQHQGGDGARGQQWLIIGPWVHGGEDSNVCGEAVFPENAAHVAGPGYDTLMDYYLGGFDTELLLYPAVTYYTMGDLDDPQAPGNEWRFAGDWPIPATETAYYLHAGGGLNTTAPVGIETTSWTFDPSDPSPTVGGRNLIIEAGIYDQQQVEVRDDILIFETDILAATLEVTGRVTCRFYVSCDQVDTDVAVRLCDVYPDGRSMLILDGILRLRYRESVEQATLMMPGQVYEVEIDLWSTSMVFNAGHRIRLSVTGSNYPRWDRNPGTGEQWYYNDEYVVQTTTLYQAPDRPSALILPVVEQS
jgi:predicted acyl esterase